MAVLRDASGVGMLARLDHAPEAFKEYEANPGRVLRIVIDSESKT